MKKLFVFLAFVAMSMLSVAQVNQLVWANGRLLYGTPVESMDSLTYDEMQDIDTLHLLLPRTLVKVIYDTVYVHDTVYVDMPCPDAPSTPSVGIGTFSVSATKQVTFSPGNLQYTQSTNTWSFASAQYECIGTDNVVGGSVNFDREYGYYKSGAVLADKVDLFDWSTNTNNFGVNTSTDNNYSGSFVDWGANKIGNDAPNTWRTLSYDEWSYLRYTRTNANDLCGVAQVNGVNGLIFLPDNWTCPAGVTFKSGFHSEWGVDYYAAYQTYTVDQWSKLESAGAVFLPATGLHRHDDSVVLGVQYSGHYWCATENDNGNTCYILFTSDEAKMHDYNRYNGLSVRLVQDIEGETTDPEQPGEGGEDPVEPNPGTPDTPEEPETPSAGIGAFSVSATKQVTFSPGNLQYTRSTDTWSFASAQYKVIGTNNVTGGWEEDDYDLEYGYSHNGTAWADKVDLFSWSTTTNNFGVCTSTGSGSFVDWGTNKIDNNAPNTWRTLTKDEWNYLRYDRNDASSLCGVASVGGVNGIIFLPDNWTCPAGVTFESGFYGGDGAHLYYSHQYIPIDKWSKLEAAGAVFLPAAGYCPDGCFVKEEMYCGYYWSATWDSYFASFLCFGSDRASIGSGDRGCGRSVRLVQDL